MLFVLQRLWTLFFAQCIQCWPTLIVIIRRWWLVADYTILLLLVLLLLLLLVNKKCKLIITMLLKYNSEFEGYYMCNWSHINEAFKILPVFFWVLIPPAYFQLYFIQAQVHLTDVFYLALIYILLDALLGCLCHAFSRETSYNIVFINTHI